MSDYNNYGTIIHRLRIKWEPVTSRRRVKIVQIFKRQKVTHLIYLDLDQI